MQILKQAFKKVMFAASTSNRSGLLVVGTGREYDTDDGILSCIVYDKCISVDKATVENCSSWADVCDHGISNLLVRGKTTW